MIINKAQNTTNAEVINTDQTTDAVGCTASEVNDLMTEHRELVKKPQIDEL